MDSKVNILKYDGRTNALIKTNENENENTKILEQDRNVGKNKLILIFYKLY